MRCAPNCMRPTGKREHCSICHLTFSGGTAGDRHRVAAHVDHRGKRTSYRNRCMTADEMTAAGLVLGEDGVWRGTPPATNWEPRDETHARSPRRSDLSASQATGVAQTTPTAEEASQR